MAWTDQIAPVAAVAFVIGAMATLVVLLAGDLERKWGGDRVRLVKDWFDYAVGIFVIGGVLVAIIAALVAYNELRDVKENARVAQTLGYVSRYKSGPLFEEVRRFANFLTGYAEAARKVGGSSGVKQLYSTPNAVGNAIEPIRDLTDFYDDLYVCSVAGICEAALAARLIGRQEIVRLYAWVQPLLPDQRVPGGSCGLKAFRDMAIRGGETLDPDACPALIR